MPADETANAPRLVEELVRRAEAAGVSDIHLQLTGECLEIAFRLDGLLSPVEKIRAPESLHVIGRVKYLARLQTWQSVTPQDGRINKADIGGRHDLRVATYPTVGGEKIVLRLFAQAELPRLEGLNLPPPALAELTRFLAQPAGLLLLTGPAGSGKTTTIYACLRQLAESGGRHIITIEDPVEQVLPGIMQTELNEAQGLDYARAARHLLRQDPQVLVIGEIRDEETARLAVRSALTGHLVIATLHAGSCRGVFERLWLMVPDHAATAGALALVLNQRLLRRRCSPCAGRGCAACLQTGFHGRLPVAEWVTVNEALRARLHEAGPGVVEPSGENLRRQALALVRESATTESELHRVLGAAP